MEFSKIHRSVNGESLIEIADRFHLSSWRAIVYAPGNEHVRDYHGRAPLAVDTQIRVPPRAYDLLKRRVFALHCVRPVLDHCFAMHEQRLAKDLAQHNGNLDLASKPAVSGLLMRLDHAVREDISHVQAECEIFVRINSALIETHLHNEPDIKTYGGYVNPEAGICWLLEKRLIDRWLELWSVNLWLERWVGCDFPEAVSRATLYFGTIRSKVMQQVDRRLRESQAAMDRLLNEAGSGPNQGAPSRQG